MRKHLPLATAALLWALAIGFGFRALLVYAYTPGSPARAAAAWPAGTAVPANPGRARLVIFAHPQCACSRATVAELAGILLRNTAPLDAAVVFLAPRSMGRAWVAGALWRQAARIPGVRLLADVSGREATLFGAATSGQTFLYAADGRLLFKGGITGARGHAGANAGSEAILSLLRGRAAARTVTPVFGCALRSEPGA